MNKLSTKILVVTIVLFSVYSVVNASFSFTSWPYSRSIETNGATGMLKVVLPTDISWTTFDFRDVRIIDGQGGEVPYLLTRSMTYSAPVSSVRLIDTSTQNDGTTRLISDTGRSGIVHTGLGIDSSSPNFRRQVSIYASDTLLPLDDQRWSLVTNTGYIFKFTDPYSSFTSGKNNIYFPANASRYFKIVVNSGPEGAVAINRVSFQSDISVEKRSFSKEFPIFVYNNPIRKTTEVTIDLGFSGYLSNEMTIYPMDSNYSRRVIIEGTDDMYATSSWRYVGESSISGVSTSVFKGSSNVITYPEQRTRYIRASIVNDDNPPLSMVAKAIVVSPVLSVIFEAQNGKTYGLYYGNKYANKPNYDITRLSSYIEEKSLPVVSISQETQNPEYVAPVGPVVPFTEANKGLLNGLLVLVVVVIGGGIIMYLRMYMKGRDFIRYYNSKFK